jgi:hypothetical protein
MIETASKAIADEGVLVVAQSGMMGNIALKLFAQPDGRSEVIVLAALGWTPRCTRRGIDRKG